jgi:catechol 2,3-dioxygenase-like lactoylglutathione lyase family enzyme
MDMKLEVVVVPNSDIERSRTFYADKMGFNVDADTTFPNDIRVIQLTPPGSACSITLMKGMGANMEPGSLKGLQLTVKDIRAAHKELAGRGVDVSEVQTVDTEKGTFVPLKGDAEPYNAFVFFDDPDGNSWAVQQGPGG